MITKGMRTSKSATSRPTMKSLLVIQIRLPAKRGQSQPVSDAPANFDFDLTCAGQRAGGEDFVGGERLDIVDADAGDADGLAEGVEEFQNSALRLAGRAGDDIDESSNIP